MENYDLMKKEIRLRGIARVGSTLFNIGISILVVLLILLSASVFSVIFIVFATMLYLLLALCTLGLMFLNEDYLNGYNNITEGSTEMIEKINLFLDNYGIYIIIVSGVLLILSIILLSFGKNNPVTKRKFNSAIALTIIFGVSSLILYFVMKFVGI